MRFLFSFVAWLSVSVTTCTEVHLIEPVEFGTVFDSTAAASVVRPPQLQSRFHKSPGIRQVFELPDDPMLSLQWYLYNYGQLNEKGVKGIPGSDIGLFPALSIYSPKREIIIAVIDSGIDLTHEDVDSSVLWTNPHEISGNGIDDDNNGYIDDVHGINFTHKVHDVQDRHYHGTHVTALLSSIRGNGIGISGATPSIKIMPIVIFGLGSTATRDQIAQGIRYACDHGAHILSNSWGSKYDNANLKEAIEYCHKKGVLFVNASGNSRENVDVEPQFPTNYQVPNQIVVGATDNRDRSAIFSNYGEQVDIAAPGDMVLSLMPKNNYRALSGTSQATPLVAGALAMLWAQEPHLTHMEVKARLLNTSDQFLALSRWVRSSARLNMYNLLSGREGRRLPEVPKGEIEKRAFGLESRHPYSMNHHNVWKFTFDGAKAIRLHFKRFELDTYGDFLEIRDSEAQVADRLNGDLGQNFYSQWISGDVVEIEFFTDKSLQLWGFEIDHIEVISASNP